MKKLFFLLAVALPCLFLTACVDQYEEYSDIEPPRFVRPVDLGLSVKWANMNVGATSPEGFGGYYAWGETGQKSEYNWMNYKYCKGWMDFITKYCFESNYGYKGFTDNKGFLDPEDDAATVHWGADWRMPTYDEIAELYRECTWEKDTLNGVEGYEVTGPSGRSIFLPNAGFYYCDDQYPNNGFISNVGRYWSSQTTDSTFPTHMEANHAIGRTYRCCGLSVRAVYRGK